MTASKTTSWTGAGEVLVNVHATKKGPGHPCLEPEKLKTPAALNQTLNHTKPNIGVAPDVRLLRRPNTRACWPLAELANPWMAPVPDVLVFFRLWGIAGPGRKCVFLTG